LRVATLLATRHTTNRSGPGVDPSYSLFMTGRSCHSLQTHPSGARRVRISCGVGHPQRVYLGGGGSRDTLLNLGGQWNPQTLHEIRARFYSPPWAYGKGWPWPFMDFLKFHPGQACFDSFMPCGRAIPEAAVFYPFGPLTPYAYGFITSSASV
jgi:hypothetical protein